jgi:hypothetical protein
MSIQNFKHSPRASGFHQPPSPNAFELAIPMRIFQAGINPTTTRELASAKAGEEFASSSEA